MEWTQELGTGKVPIGAGDLGQRPGMGKIQGAGGVPNGAGVNTINPQFSLFEKRENWWGSNGELWRLELLKADQPGLQEKPIRLMKIGGGKGNFYEIKWSGSD
jgi:hypothetical protein